MSNDAQERNSHESGSSNAALAPCSGRVQPLVWRCPCGQFNNDRERTCMACGALTHPKVVAA